MKDKYFDNLPKEIYSLKPSQSVIQAIQSNI